jgi:hypothetical protein
MSSTAKYSAPANERGGWDGDQPGERHLLRGGRPRQPLAVFAYALPVGPRVRDRSDSGLLQLDGVCRGGGTGSRVQWPVDGDDAVRDDRDVRQWPDQGVLSWSGRSIKYHRA